METKTETKTETETINYDQHINKYLVKISDRPDLQVFIRDFNEEKGFIWSINPLINEIYDLVGDENLSPVSFALDLRAIQTILRKTIKQ